MRKMAGMEEYLFVESCVDDNGMGWRRLSGWMEFQAIRPAFIVYSPMQKRKRS